MQRRKTGPLQAPRRNRRNQSANASPVKTLEPKHPRSLFPLLTSGSLLMQGVDDSPRFLSPEMAVTSTASLGECHMNISLDPV